jgi:hypothetical protein
MPGPGDLVAVARGGVELLLGAALSTEENTGTGGAAGSTTVGVGAGCGCDAFGLIASWVARLMLADASDLPESDLGDLGAMV